MIGSSVYELLIPLLAGLPGARALALFSPPPVPTLQQRLPPSSLTDAILQTSGDLRNRTSLPFWDAVNVSSFHRCEASSELLQQALFHNHAVAPRQRIPLHGLTPADLDRTCKQRPHDVTVLSSAIELDDGSVRHLPMLDFHCPASDANLPLVLAAAQTLHPHGSILKSGKSYHFYGASLLTGSENIDHLARALLLAPIVDRAWIAHQLLERSCGLRISTREERHIPIVVAEF